MMGDFDSYCLWIMPGSSMLPAFMRGDFWPSWTRPSSFDRLCFSLMTRAEGVAG